MNVEQLLLKGKDPGAVQYGNFMNYYSFHNPQYRINNLSREMFVAPKQNEPYVCLDVGCNSGQLTQALYRYLVHLHPDNDVYILGIDIDPTLIDRASQDNTVPNISFKHVDIMDKQSVEFLKIFQKEHNKSIFDVTFCFSVTMWIHLNHGDEGLLTFLNLMKNNSRSIILETQPWKCYRSAYRRMKRSNSDFPLFGSLKIRYNVQKTIENVILQKDYLKLKESSLSVWNRSVQSFYKINSV